MSTNLCNFTIDLTVDYFNLFLSPHSTQQNKKSNTAIGKRAKGDDSGSLCFAAAAAVVVIVIAVVLLLLLLLLLLLMLVW
jgi:hypothetical protein